MPKDNTQEIAAGVALALAKSTSDTAIAVARTAADTAAQLAISTAKMSGDVTFIKDEITSLAREMKEGFLSTHTRQDITNGKVIKAGADIVVLSEVKVDHEARMRSMENKFQTWIGGLAVAQFVVGIVLWYLK